ncbi:MAG: hypothetical protein MJZ74_02470 [Muribaculaceae bacterium]|nr:hypothetical protein [Muribaculaceae bacterium]
MGLFYTKKKEEDKNAIDFMEVRDAQQATQAITTGQVVSPLPYDVEKKRHIDRQVEVEQRPK